MGKTNFLKFYSEKFKNLLYWTLISRLSTKELSFLTFLVLQRRFLRNLTILQENNCPEVSLFKEVLVPIPRTSFKKSIPHRCFPDNFVEFLKTSIAWKVSIFGVFLVRIFLHSNWMRESQWLFSQTLIWQRC